jgi:hypothetical protein
MRRLESSSPRRFLGARLLGLRVERDHSRKAADAITSVRDGKTRRLGPTEASDRTRTASASAAPLDRPSGSEWSVPDGP